MGSYFAGFGDYEHGLLNTPPPGVRFQAVDPAADYFYSCGLDLTGSIHGWGLVNDPPGTDWDRGLVVTPPAGQFQSPSVAGESACGVDLDGGTFSDLSVGFEHACAVRSSDIDPDPAVDTTDTAVCWGLGYSDSMYATPDPTDKFKQLSVGNREYATCGIRKSTDAGVDGTLDCWNLGRWQVAPPADALALRGVRALGGGPHQMCAIDAARELVCWGGGHLMHEDHWRILPLLTREGEAAERWRTSGPEHILYGPLLDRTAAEAAGARLAVPTRGRQDCLALDWYRCAWTAGTGRMWLQTLAGAAASEQLRALEWLYLSAAPLTPATLQSRFVRLQTKHGKWTSRGEKGLVHEERTYQAGEAALELHVWLVYAQPGGPNLLTQANGEFSQPITLCLPRPRTWQDGSIWAVWDGEQWQALAAAAAEGNEGQVCVRTKRLGALHQLDPFGWSPGAETGAEISPCVVPHLRRNLA